METRSVWRDGRNAWWHARYEWWYDRFVWCMTGLHHVMTDLSAYEKNECLGLWGDLIRETFKAYEDENVTHKNQYFP